MMNWIQVDNQLLAQWSTFPEQHDFMLWAADLLQQQHWQCVSIEQGADRAQLHFVYENQDLLLCYEGNCEAIWIESIKQVSSTCFSRLLTNLSAGLK